MPKPMAAKQCASQVSEHAGSQPPRQQPEQRSIQLPSQPHVQPHAQLPSQPLPQPPTQPPNLTPTVRSHTRRAWIELDRDNLHHNVALVSQLLADHCELMPAVKANAYGHGAAEISRELSLLGVHAFCVASVDEGIELRQALECSDMLSDNVSEILILGYTHPDQFYLLQRYQLTQTAVDYEHAMAIAEFGRRYHVKLPIHLKIDTGMRRLGIKSENRLDIMQVLSCKHLNVTGIYTHFSTRNYDFTLAQAQRFDALLTFITESGFSLPKVHSQSSYGVFACQNYAFDHAFDYARVGLALYGIHANDGGSSGLPDLRPVLSLRARVSCVKDIRAGEFIGYGAEFQATLDMKIAILSIGYADGVPRSLSNGVGQVLVNGSVAKVVGLICMDQMTVDVSDIDDVYQGGTATLIGKDGDQEIKVVDIARQAGTIPNEILSRLGSRLDR